MQPANNNVPFRLYPKSPACTVVHRPPSACGSCPQLSDRTSPQRCLAQIARSVPICQRHRCPGRRFYIHAFCVCAFFCIGSVRAFVVLVPRRVHCNGSSYGWFVFVCVRVWIEWVGPWWHDRSQSYARFFTAMDDDVYNLCGG